MKYEPEKRSYRQGRRADAAQATVDKILDSFVARMAGDWFDEIRLEDLARDAGVTVQTVIRRFGSKEGLLDAAADRLSDEIHERRTIEPGNIRAVVDLVLEDYELTGDLVMRMLSQEDRHPAVRRLADVGRSYHRAWLRAAFAPMLDPLPDEEARHRLDMLVTATDVYIWKLIRRDMQRPLPELADLMMRQIAAALADDRPTETLKEKVA